MDGWMDGPGTLGKSLSLGFPIQETGMMAAPSLSASETGTHVPIIVNWDLIWEGVIFSLVGRAHVRHHFEMGASSSSLDG